MYKPQNQIPRQFGGKRHTGGGDSHSKPNRSQQKPNRGFLGLLPHYPAYLFTLGSLCIVFILLFLPWQTQQDRQDWTFRQSVKHDLDNYKGFIANLFPSPSTSTSTVTITTTTTVKPPVEATPLPSKEVVPEVKMSTTEQTWVFYPRSKLEVITISVELTWRVQFHCYQAWWRPGTTIHHRTKLWKIILTFFLAWPCWCHRLSLREPRVSNTARPAIDATI